MGGKNKQTSETDPDQTSPERKRGEREHTAITRDCRYSLSTRCATAHTFIIRNYRIDSTSQVQKPTITTTLDYA